METKLMEENMAAGWHAGEEMDFMDEDYADSPDGTPDMDLEEAGQPCPECREVTCFANTDGRCQVLTDTCFGGRKCPFHKTEEDLKDGQLEALGRLVETGRFDLAEKYRKPMQELGILEPEDSFFDEYGSSIAYLAQLRETEKQLKEKDGLKDTEGGSTDIAEEGWEDDAWDDGAGETYVPADASIPPSGEQEETE